MLILLASFFLFIVYIFYLECFILISSLHFVILFFCVYLSLPPSSRKGDSMSAQWPFPVIKNASPLHTHTHTQTHTHTHTHTLKTLLHTHTQAQTASDTISIATGHR